MAATTNKNAMHMPYWKKNLHGDNNNSGQNVLRRNFENDFKVKILNEMSMFQEY